MTLRAVRGRAAVTWQKVPCYYCYSHRGNYRSIATGNRHLDKMDLKRSFIAHSNSVASYQAAAVRCCSGATRPSVAVSRRKNDININSPRCSCSVVVACVMGIRKVSARPA